MLNNLRQSCGIASASTAIPGAPEMEARVIRCYAALLAQTRIPYGQHSLQNRALRGTPFAIKQRMRVAIPLWQGRVSPVFDEASRILLVDIFKNSELNRQEAPLLARNPFHRAQLLPTLGVDLLICGMISQTQRAALAPAGIKIIPHICGTMEEVIAAFLDGQIEDGALRMPGCGKPKRWRGQMGGVGRK
jgi:predicted Fe-Mo cluster-binding NifX family protein